MGLIYDYFLKNFVEFWEVYIFCYGMKHTAIICSISLIHSIINSSTHLVLFHLVHVPCEMRHSDSPAMIALVSPFRFCSVCFRKWIVRIFAAFYLYNCYFFLVNCFLIYIHWVHLCFLLVLFLIQHY